MVAIHPLRDLNGMPQILVRAYLERHYIRIWTPLLNEWTQHFRNLIHFQCKITLGTLNLVFGLKERAW